MPAVESVEIQYEPISESIVQCTIDVHDRALLNHPAELRIVRKAIVHGKGAVNVSQVLLSRKIGRLQPQNVVPIHRANMKFFCYEGSRIDIETHTELIVDKRLFADSTISQREQITLSPRPELDANAKELIDPEDVFGLLANLVALPAASRLLASALLLIAGILIAVNTAAGIHDQFVPEPMVWLYDHHGRGGRRMEFPVLKSFQYSLWLGAGVWFAAKGLLRKYMKFELNRLPQHIDRHTVIPASQLLRGRAPIELERVRVRVVACNMELGQARGEEKTFKYAVRAVVLFDQRIPLIPAHARVEAFLEGEVRFEPMFRSLYPPQPVGKHHGLALHWEVQLIHGKYLDQEIVGPVDRFVWDEFLPARRADSGDSAESSSSSEEKDEGIQTHGKES